MPSNYPRKTSRRLSKVLHKRYILSPSGDVIGMELSLGCGHEVRRSKASIKDQQWLFARCPECQIESKAA